MLFKAITFTGILAGIALLWTATSGVLHMEIELHERSAQATVALGVLHFGLITYKNWKIKHPSKK